MEAVKNIQKEQEKTPIVIIVIYNIGNNILATIPTLPQLMVLSKTVDEAVHLIKEKFMGTIEAAEEMSVEDKKKAAAFDFAVIELPAIWRGIHKTIQDHKPTSMKEVDLEQQQQQQTT